jgi:hypothetical protein
VKFNSTTVHLELRNVHVALAHVQKDITQRYSMGTFTLVHQVDQRGLINQS